MLLLYGPNPELVIRAMVLKIHFFVINSHPGMFIRISYIRLMNNKAKKTQFSIWSLTIQVQSPSSNEENPNVWDKYTWEGDW